MSVLILEDNRQILKVLEKLVLSVAEDEKVYVTDNVGEAYKIAMEISIDVFMLDIILYGDKKGDTSGQVCSMHNLCGSWSVTVLHLLFLLLH